MTTEELRNMMRGYIQDAIQTNIPSITLLNSIMEAIEEYKTSDNTQARHDEACCDDDNLCECGMEGNSLFSKITKNNMTRTGGLMSDHRPVLKPEYDKELKELKIKYPPPPLKVDPKKVMKSAEGTGNNDWFKYFTKLRKNS